jgi:alpha-ribazole phosphatase
MAELWIWRHPKPVGAAARCIGQTDLPVDPRRAKRLAHRIRQTARREGLPHAVATSPLRRGADVGRWLRRWGWRHQIDARLLELDFGRWDGQRWSAIAHADVLAWEADFLRHAPGGGESLQQLHTRVSDALAAVRAGHLPRLVVGHAGWINLLGCRDALAQGTLTAATWPVPPRHGQRVRYPVQLPVPSAVF